MTHLPDEKIPDDPEAPTGATVLYAMLFAFILGVVIAAIAAKGLGVLP